MIIIAEANMLPKLTDADKKALLALAASDKVIVLSDVKSSVPIDTMQLFMAMKAKTEFIQLDDIKVGFGLGYQYGEFSKLYAKDKVKILTNNDYSKVVSSNMVCVKSLAAVKKTTTTAKKVAPAKVALEVKKDTKKKAEPKTVTKEVKPAEKKSTKKEAPTTASEAMAKISTRKPKLKDLSADSMIASYPALKPYKTKIATLNGMFIDAIKKSTDPNVSFKMQLQMIFAEDTEEIWKVIKKDFAKLKALADM